MIEIRSSRSGSRALRQPAVVPLERRQALAAKRRVARCCDDSLHRLGDHGRLHVPRHAGQPASRDEHRDLTRLEEVPVVGGATDPRLIPEHDVRNESARLLPGEEAAQLVSRPLGVGATPDDRVEARIPEPLERILAVRRNRVAERLPVMARRFRIGRQKAGGRPVETLGHARLYGTPASRKARFSFSISRAMTRRWISFVPS